MAKQTLQEIIKDFLVIAEEEVSEGTLNPTGRYTPAMLVECSPPGTSLEQVCSALSELTGFSARVFSDKPEQIVVYAMQEVVQCNLI